MFSSLSNSQVVKYIIAVNAIVYLLMFYTPVGQYYDLLAMFYIDTPYFKSWQLVTHMFMHGGFLHIAMNMYGVFLFGTILERIWGAQRFLFYYMATGIGAGMIYLLVEGIRFKMNLGTFFPYTEGLAYKVIPVVGASGAVFGILIAFAMLFPNTELRLLFFPVPIKAKYLIGGYVVYELVTGLMNTAGDNVAHFAHLGGALVGFLILFYWQKTNRKSLY
ncbi:MAG: rhomboid family intramembrane serine protease [Chitinophagales bacterium]